MLVVGVDPGKNTGFAIWDTVMKRFTVIKTLKIHRAMERILALKSSCADDVLVRIEDARMRKWFGDTSSEVARMKKQGAGSVKRDCTIWEDFCKDYQIRYELVAPGTFRSGKDEMAFIRITGLKDIQTSEHGRDAAMLVFNYR